MIRQCKVCGEYKPLELFELNKNCKYGITYRCKACTKIYMQQYSKTYRILNKEKLKNKEKKYRLEHLHKYAEKTARYRLRHPEKIKEYQSTEECRINCAKRAKKYRQNHPEKSREYKQRDYVKIIDRLRYRLWYVLKRFNNNKQNSILGILGCSSKEFKKYLENQFDDNMNWDNYGKWHIDHIIPLSSAKNIDELENLFHYKNCQPLWARDNLRKANKLTVTCN